MSSDNFTPNTAFEGYVAAKLENIEKKFDGLPCPETLNRLIKCETDISNIQGKATIISLIVGFFSAFITKYILGK